MPKLCQTFKKRITNTLKFGKSVHNKISNPEHSCFAADNKFPENFNVSDWYKWLGTVKNFYKHSSKLSPVIASKPFDNRPYLEVQILSQPFTLLLDTGCSTTVVGSKGLDFLERNNIEIDLPCSQNVSLADGSSKKVSGIVDLPFVANGICHVISCLVVPSLPINFILGSNFISKFSLAINFEQNKWSVRNPCCEIVTSKPEGDVSFPQSLCSIDSLAAELRPLADAVIHSFQEVDKKNGIGRTDKIKMTIDTGDAKPFRQRPFPMSPYMSDILNRELDEMLKLKVIEPSNSPWCSPVLLVKKKTGEFRFCFDGRNLNEVTRHDTYPLPNIDRILSLLRNAKYISSIDLKKLFGRSLLIHLREKKLLLLLLAVDLFNLL